MNAVRTVLAFVAGSVLSGHLATADIDARAPRAEVYFSDTTNRDEVVATVKGRDCQTAVFSLSIRRADGDLFRREIPLHDIAWCNPPDEVHLRRFVAGLVNEAVSVKRSADLGCRRPMIGCWEAPALARLKRVSAAVLCFWTGPEDFACVAYDPDVGEVVEVTRYSE